MRIGKGLEAPLDLFKSSEFGHENGGDKFIILETPRGELAHDQVMNFQATDRDVIDQVL